MKITRREVVGRAGALGVALAAGPVPAFGHSASPVRMPLTEFVRDSARVESLRRGVAVMKARPASDHRSWFFQAAVHAYDDALYADALAQDPNVAQVDRARYWNKCTHFGQSSANFVIWHRAYLYYFERILRDAAGDPNLAVPYWDYTREDNRDFPEIFANEYVDRAKRTPNPLYHSNRDLAFVIGTLGISEAVGRAAATLDSNIFFSDIGITGFAGDVLGEDETQVGLLEQRPHNDIHLAVGGVVGTANGAMADVRTAAFDPVFWVHHANIDRMWVEWSSARGKGWGALPPDEWLDENAWIFLDVDGREKTNSRRFYIDRANLPVRYDIDGRLGAPIALQTPPPPPPPPPTNGATAPSSTETVVTTAMVKAAAPKRTRTLLTENIPINVSPSSPSARVLGSAAKPTENLVGAAPPQQGIPAPAPVTAEAAPILNAPAIAPDERVLLELSDIRFDRVPSSGFAVYLIEGRANVPSDPVGLLNLFGATHMQMPGMTMKAVQRFDVTRIVGHSAGPFTLRIEPYDLLVRKSGAPAPKRADEVHIGSVRFVVVS